MYETGELAQTLGIVPPSEAPEDAPVASEPGAPPLQIKNNLAVDAQRPAAGRRARVAVIHHLQQPFLGNAAAPLGAVREHFGTLPDLDEVDAIVSFGGEQSAWDPELAPEVELIREAVAREIPFLGVCLGAQLLAHALGGEVSRLDAASSRGRRSR